MKSTIDKAKSSIGYSTAGSGEARKELNARILEQKERYDKELLKFKTDIKGKQYGRKNMERSYKRRERPAPY